MNCIELYGARYVFAYVMIVELYIAWFITVGFEYYYSIIILYVNAVVMCILLNDKVHYLESAICRNWRCYIRAAYWFYGYNALRYTYENKCPRIHTYSYGIPMHLPIRNDIPTDNPNTLAGIEYIEQLLYCS